MSGFRLFKLLGWVAAAVALAVFVYYMMWVRKVENEGGFDPPPPTKHTVPSAL